MRPSANMYITMSLALLGLVNAAQNGLDPDHHGLPAKGDGLHLNFGENPAHNKGYVFDGDESMNSFPWDYIKTHRPEMWNKTVQLYEALDCENQRAWQDSFLSNMGPSFWKPCNLEEALHGPTKIGKLSQHDKQLVMHASGRSRLNWMIDHYGSPLEKVKNNYVVPLFYYKLPKSIAQMISTAFFDGNAPDGRRIGLRSRDGSIKAWNNLSAKSRTLALRYAEALSSIAKYKGKDPLGELEVMAGLRAISITNSTYNQSEEYFRNILMGRAWLAAGGQKQQQDPGRFLIYKHIFRNAADQLLNHLFQTSSTGERVPGESSGNKHKIAGISKRGGGGPPGKMLPNKGQDGLQNVVEGDKDVETTYWDRLEHLLKDQKEKQRIAAGKPVEQGWNPRSSLRHYPMPGDRSTNVKAWDEQDWENHVNRLHHEQDLQNLEEPGANPIDRPNPPPRGDVPDHRPMRNKGVDFDNGQSPPSSPEQPQSPSPQTPEHETPQGKPEQDQSPSTDTKEHESPQDKTEDGKPSSSDQHKDPSAHDETDQDGSTSGGSDDGEPTHDQSDQDKPSQGDGDKSSPSDAGQDESPSTNTGEDKTPQPDTHDDNIPPTDANGDEYPPHDIGEDKTPPTSPKAGEGTPPHSSLPDDFYKPGTDTEMDSAMKQLIEDGRELDALNQKPPSEWLPEDFQKFRAITERFNRFVQFKRASKAPADNTEPTKDTEPSSSNAHEGEPEEPNVSPEETKVSPELEDWDDDKWSSTEKLIEEADEIKAKQSSPSGSIHEDAPMAPLSEEEGEIVQQAGDLESELSKSVEDLGDQLRLQAEQRVKLYEQKYNLDLESPLDASGSPSKGSLDDSPAQGELPSEGETPVQGERPGQGEPPVQGERPAQGQQPIQGEPPVEGGEGPVGSPGSDIPGSSRFPNGEVSNWPIDPKYLQGEGIRDGFMKMGPEHWNEAEWRAFGDWAAAADRQNQLPRIPEAELPEVLEKPISAKQLPRGFRSWLRRAWEKIKYYSKATWDTIRNVFPKKAARPISMPGAVKDLPEMVPDLDFSSPSAPASSVHGSTETLEETVHRLFGETRPGSALDGVLSEHSSSSWETIEDAESVASQVSDALTPELMEADDIINGAVSIENAALAADTTGLLATQGGLVSQELNAVQAARTSLTEAGGELGGIAADSGLTLVRATEASAATIASTAVRTGSQLLEEADLASDALLPLIGIGLVPIITMAMDPRKKMQFKNRWIDVDGDGMLEFVKYYYEKADPHNDVMANWSKDLDKALEEGTSKQVAATFFSGVMKIANAPFEPLTFHHKDENRFTVKDEKYGWIHQKWQGPYVPVMSKFRTAQGTLAEILLNWNDPAPDKVRRAWNWFMELVESDRHLCTKGGDIEAWITGNFHPAEASTLYVKYHFGRPSGTYCWDHPQFIFEDVHVRRSSSGGRFDGQLDVKGDIDGDNVPEFYRMKSKPNAKDYPGELTIWWDAIQDNGGYCDAQGHADMPCSSDVFFGRGEIEHTILVAQGWQFDKRDRNITVHPRNLPAETRVAPAVPNTHPMFSLTMEKAEDLRKAILNTIWYAGKSPRIRKWLEFQHRMGTYSKPGWIEWATKPVEPLKLSPSQKQNLNVPGWGPYTEVFHDKFTEQ